MVKRKKILIRTVLALLLLFAMNANQLLVSARTLSYETTVRTRNEIANDWTYYKRGYADYNCLAYAMGNNTTWYWPWGQVNPTISEAKKWFTNNCHYWVADKNAKNGLTKYVIYVYANSQGRVTHFARTTKINGEALSRGVDCVAKWGQSELFTHKTRDPYKKNGIYGSIAFIAHNSVQYWADKVPPR